MSHTKFDKTFLHLVAAKMDMPGLQFAANEYYYALAYQPFNLSDMQIRLQLRRKEIYEQDCEWPELVLRRYMGLHELPLDRELPIRDMNESSLVECCAQTFSKVIEEFPLFTSRYILTVHDALEISKKVTEYPDFVKVTLRIFKTYPGKLLMTERAILQEAVKRFGPAVEAEFERVLNNMQVAQRLR